MPDRTPTLPNDLNRAGIFLANECRYEEALEHFQRAAEAIPPFAPAFSNMGFVLNSLGRPEEALTCLRRALELSPNFADGHNNMGVALQELGRSEEAIESYARALHINPHLASAHNNMATALATLGRHDAAIRHYHQALRIEPMSASAFYNLGLVLRQRGRLSEAMECLTRATALKPDFAAALRNLGSLLSDCGRPQEAIAAFSRALAVDPSLSMARAQRLHQLARICDWTEIASELAVAPMLGLTGGIVPPFSMLSLQDQPDKQLVRAQRFAAERYGSIKRKDIPLHRHEKLHSNARPGRLRIAYFSSDFHNHATMFLMARMLELHNKNRFEIHAFSYDEVAPDAMQQRLLGAVDRFHDVCALDDSAIAELARSNAIDIAIDLKGYTQNARTGIFAYRAAPIQVSYLGYPGSMGAEFMDYIVADEVVLPKVLQSFYAEKVIYLPRSYQVNDNQRVISDRGFERAELGLPANGFVFCCFNNSYKISPAEFDVWMRLLRAVQGSVLWLMKANESAEANLRSQAQARGVEPDRLVFAERAPQADHLARHRCADLFLDTFNYNAHTTASDALWSGLPIVTKLGNSFAARVAGSLLHTIDLPELVTDTAEAYERLALALATHPDQLAAVRTKLATNRLTTPLYDTESFTRDIERAYDLAYQRYADGEPPDHIRLD